jgi:hypothetical protein
MLDFLASQTGRDVPETHICALRLPQYHAEAFRLLDFFSKISGIIKYLVNMLL